METHRDDHGGRQALRFASSPRQHRSDRFPHASKNSCPCWQQTAGRGQYFAFSLSWYHRVPSRFSRVSSRTSIRTRVSPGTRCLLVSDTDEAALLSNLRPWLAGPASKRSRRDARYPSAYGPFSGSSCNLRSWLGKWPKTFASSPQSVQQNCQLASHRHHRSLFAALASTGGQLQSPAS